MDLTLIVNPVASSVTDRRRRRVEEQLRSLGTVEVVETRRRGHATELAVDAARRAVDAVVVLAGDGTLNEAANGLVASAAGSGGARPALAVLPGGSTNVYARAIGVPNQLGAATAVVAEALRTRNVRSIGVGAVNGRRFLFHCGIGFDAAVIERVERRQGFLKRHATPLWFGVNALATWARRANRQTSFTISADGTPRIDHCPFAIVSNISPYTYLGPRPLVVSPGATIDSPLTVMGLQTLRLGVVLRTLASAMARGRYLHDEPLIQHRTGVERLIVESAAPVPYQVDGDFLGRLSRFELTFERDALDIVVPDDIVVPECSNRAWPRPKRHHDR